MVYYIRITYILGNHLNEYPTVIQSNFQGIFYLDNENEWLDRIITNINLLENEYKRSLAFFALFQACIIKRPYNLFHRANLSVRTTEVKRSFGNKVTWDTSFEVHFRKFINEANVAVFNTTQKCLSLNYDAVNFPVEQYNPQLIYSTIS